MLSINTNAAAIGALANLRQLDTQMTTINRQISTGLRVEIPKDNPEYWTIATSLRAQKSSIEPLLDGLGIADSRASTASQGLQKIEGYLKEIKAQLTLATNPGADLDRISKNIESIKNNIRGEVGKSTFRGSNWLQSDAAPGRPARGARPAVPADVTNEVYYSSFATFADGKVSTQKVEFDPATTALIHTNSADAGILTKQVDGDALRSAPTGTAENYTLFLADPTGTLPAGVSEVGVQAGVPATGRGAAAVPAVPATTADQIENMIAVVEQMRSEVADAAAAVGDFRIQIERSQDALKSSADLLAKNIGQLVDADMNEASARLRALQTQQQLAIQALSIANNNQAGILRLFQN